MVLGLFGLVSRSSGFGIRAVWIVVIEIICEFGNVTYRVVGMLDNLSPRVSIRLQEKAAAKAAAEKEAEEAASASSMATGD